MMREMKNRILRNLITLTVVVSICTSNALFAAVEKYKLAAVSRFQSCFAKLRLINDQRKSIAAAEELENFVRQAGEEDLSAAHYILTESFNCLSSMGAPNIIKAAVENKTIGPRLKSIAGQLAKEKLEKARQVYLESKDFIEKCESDLEIMFMYWRCMDYLSDIINLSLAIPSIITSQEMLSLNEYFKDLAQIYEERLEYLRKKIRQKIDSDPSRTWCVKYRVLIEESDFRYLGQALILRETRDMLLDVLDFARSEEDFRELMRGLLLRISRGKQDSDVKLFCETMLSTILDMSEDYDFERMVEDNDIRLLTQNEIRELYDKFGADCDYLESKGLGIQNVLKTILTIDDESAAEMLVETLCASADCGDSKVFNAMEQLAGYLSKSIYLSEQDQLVHNLKLLKYFMKYTLLSDSAFFADISEQLRENIMEDNDGEVVRLSFHLLCEYLKRKIAATREVLSPKFKNKLYEFIEKGPDDLKLAVTEYYIVCLGVGAVKSAKEIDDVLRIADYYLWADPRNEALRQQAVRIVVYSIPYSRIAKEMFLKILNTSDEELMLYAVQKLCVRIKFIDLKEISGLPGLMAQRLEQIVLSNNDDKMIMKALRVLNQHSSKMPEMFSTLNKVIPYLRGVLFDFSRLEALREEAAWSLGIAINVGNEKVMLEVMSLTETIEDKRERDRAKSIIRRHYKKKMKYIERDLKVVIFRVVENISALYKARVRSGEEVGSSL